MITGVDGIRAAYQDEGVARRYVEERFTTPLGSLLHDRQCQVLRSVIAAHPAPEIFAALQTRADHPSALVREHVAWAMARHAGKA